MFQCSVVLNACFSFGILIHSRILIWQLYWWWFWSPQSQILFMEYILHQGRLLKSYQEVGFISVQYPPQATTWLLSTAGAFRGCQAQLDGEGFDGRGGKTFESSGRITPGISQWFFKIHSNTGFDLECWFQLNSGLVKWFEARGMKLNGVRCLKSYNWDATRDVMGSHSWMFLSHVPVEFMNLCQATGLQSFRSLDFQNYEMLCTAVFGSLKVVPVPCQK